MASKDKQPLRAVDKDSQGARQDSTINTESADTSLRRKGIFLLPNVITTGALFAGFYAIIAAMNGDFLPAVLAIFIAMFLDTADGRVARITMSESAFGAQYDSLSDMVAFGAPYLANPDLAERLLVGAAYNKPDRATFYGGSAAGYTDYPFLGQ